MRNKQSPEKRQFREDEQLFVHSIFTTIQGEGPFTGHRAVFIRLAGCNLQCPACDTEYTNSRMLTDPETLLAAVQNKLPSGTLVVITGGEPLRQDVTKLCWLLVDAGYFVQIETNGTLPPPSALFSHLCSTDLDGRRCVFVVCSPKTGSVNKDLLKHISAYKYVLSHDETDNDGLPVLALGHSAAPRVARPHEGFSGPVYLQPQDSEELLTNNLHLEAVKASCMEHGYILQLQVHKIIHME